MQGIDIFPWDDNFDTGLAKVDEQHRKLVQLLNRLASHVAFKTDLPQLNVIFDELADYAVYHFETEEAIWAEHLAGDPLEVGHKVTHEKFIQAVLRFRSYQDSKPIAQVLEEVLAFLARWLASHILETDRHMAYIVRGLRSGMSMDEAKRHATEQMSGSTRALIDIILSIYETLSMNTLQLMREIAERKRNEEALQQARLQAEAANVAKSRFLANMSHELRTPMNAILGMAQLLREPDVVSETERQEYAQIIIDSGQSLLELLTGILDLAKVEAGKIELEPAVFSPGQLLRKVGEQHLATAQKKGLALDTVEAGLPAGQYRSDPRLITQMLDHLLNNAVKFTEQGRVAIEVREVEPALLEFSVTDTGIGIVDEKKAQLFQPFTQGDDSSTRRYGGTGLGLSMVRSLAHLLGGEVGVESAPGKGSRFWFRIPVVVSASAAG
jgi:hemerythrin-like metal-binding protein